MRMECSCAGSWLLNRKLKGVFTRCLSSVYRMTPQLLRHVQTRPLTMENHAVCRREKVDAHVTALPAQEQAKPYPSLEDVCNVRRALVVQ